jgi:outer membrane protein assembly factor BamD
MMKKFNFIILCLLCLFIAACSSTDSNDTTKLYKKQTEAQIFNAGEKAMLKGDYNLANQRFSVIASRYPFGKHASQALLDSIYCYYKEDDLPTAFAQADQFIRMYPRNSHVDYAYYMRGIIEMNQNHSFFERYFPADFAKRDLATLNQAYLDFKQLIRLFPKSVYVQDSRQRMVYIRNLFARHTLQVAQFYYDHENYVAAADRANEVVRKYQQTPSIPDALVVMIKSYRKLNLTKEADDAQKVLKLNFPGKSVD